MTALDGAGRAPAPGHADGRSDPSRAAPRWVGRAIRLYPPAWRARFGAEFAALLEATPLSPRVLFDVLVAAVDAHVHPTGPRRRWPLMIERLRMAELVVFASWVAFAVAGLAFQRMTDGSPFTGIADAQPAVRWSYLAVVAGAAVSLAAVTVAGIPIALAIARQAIAARAWRRLALLAVPPAALVLWIGATLLLLASAARPVGDARLVLFGVWAGLFLVAAVASTVAVGAAALGADVDGALYRRATAPALVTAAAMLVVLAAVVAWGAALAISEPATFWGSEGILGGSTVATWLGVVAVMAIATASAVRAARRARREPVA